MLYNQTASLGVLHSKELTDFLHGTVVGGQFVKFHDQL